MTEMNLCIILKDQAVDWLDRDGLDGLPWSEASMGEPQSCQTTETVWLAICAPPHAFVTTGWGAGSGAYSVWA